MIVYKALKTQFIEDVGADNIEDVISSAVENALGKKVGKSEYQSWANSLPQVEQILRDPDIPNNAVIAIEYSIPRTQNRIDFMITGKSASKQNTAILIELKQWSKATATGKDGIINTRFSHGEKDTLHPSYQVWSYASLLESFNAAVYEKYINLKPCVYLHNYKDDGILSDAFFEHYTQQAPLFFKDDKRDLREYIKSHIKFGDDEDILNLIENSEIRPSKKLADHLDSLLKGNKSFTLIDDQKEVFEEAIQLTKKARAGNDNKKQVLIIRGGPGTGKSVVAINLLAYFTRLGLVAQYVTRNAAPREVYQARLTGTMKKTVFSAMFQGSGSYVDVKKDSYDTLVVDEAHRLNEKSGMVGHLGENQVKEIINAASCSVFFLDEDQRISLKDIGSQEEIEYWAKHLDAEVTVMDLESQFRCSGSDGYLSWLNNNLGIRETANKTLSKKEFDFRVYDNPNDLREAIFSRNKDGKEARLLAGYCWKWITKSTSGTWKALSQEEKDKTFDITFPEYDFGMRWNLSEQGQGWLNHPESINEVGCIHTCQGLEMNYAGVIIGDDFQVRNGRIIIDPSAHPGGDKNLQTWKKVIKENPVDGEELVHSIIKNTYKVLMTRGMDGCYIYCTDKETAQYFKDLIEN
ncbi:DUF2075 domain-containing protein [Endozoicomonas sp. ISHI1]|uniref:DUF2075 domain-containing protein n=1 Tax=Endozoicomonas sp. ISHI1 TaxID=2825882 RepID=UPI002148EAE4|nr:DUF2075 domain-containing protein [Endozoicomonas sp. ISHI1]